MPSLELSVSPLELPLVAPFTIARSSDVTARNALLRLQWGAIAAFGETSPRPRYGESVASVEAALHERDLGTDPYALEALLDGLAPAARCGLDVALHDCIGKDLGRPLWRLFGLDAARAPLTSFTISIASIPETLEKVRAVRDAPVLKLKLGRSDVVETVEAVRAQYTGTLRLDANEAWNAEETVAYLREIARFDIEFCEQPIPAGSPDRLGAIRERVSVPIVADEDARDAAALGALAGRVDGVNVKLVKCGGIRAAREMIATARALGLKVMIGCMVESAILSTAAAHLAPLADWADLDGPFLIADDPYDGLRYADGRLVLPDGPGLGVRVRAAA